jgi:hypothetical protein
LWTPAGAAFFHPKDDVEREALAVLLAS